MSKDYKVAILDKDKILTGFRTVSIDADNQKLLDNQLKKTGISEVDHQTEGKILVVPDNCDLPVNRTYKWTGTSFILLGTNFPRPKPLPKGVDKDHTIYLLMKAIINNTPIPNECNLWIEWYEKELKKRYEDFVKRGGKR